MIIKNFEFPIFAFSQSIYFLLFYADCTKDSQLLFQMQKIYIYIFNSFPSHNTFCNWSAYLCGQNSSNTILLQLRSLKSLPTVQAKVNSSHNDANAQTKILWHFSFKIPKHFLITTHEVAQDVWIWHSILLHSKTKEHLINLTFIYSSIMA
jgi:hypothetical protein